MRLEAHGFRCNVGVEVRSALLSLIRSLGRLLRLQAPKDPLKRGWKPALDVKMTRQTEEDGLKWSLLKQVLKVCGVHAVARTSRVRGENICYVLAAC